MSSRLDPREYDVIELRDALSTAPERPETTGRESDGSDQRQSHPRFENPEDSVWLSVSKVGQDRPFEDDSGGSERGNTVTDDRSTITNTEASGLDGPAGAMSGTGSNRVESELLPLDRVPTSVAGQMAVLDWIEDLLAACCHDEAERALEYYRSIGWLSDESHEQLRNYLRGLTDSTPADGESLTIDDHRESLRHITTLARLR